MIKLITNESFVPSAMPGVSLYVRNKHPAGMTYFTPERTVLFVHGATYPAETAFDLRLDGFSWMEYIARRGFDVYLLDVRGYGRSTRPPAMDAKASANPPFADTADARADVHAVVEYIKRDRALEKLCLIGWSWGCATMGSYAAEHPENVERLVLFAPGWVREGPSAADPGGNEIRGAHLLHKLGVQPPVPVILKILRFDPEKTILDHFDWLGRFAE